MHVPPRRLTTRLEVDPEWTREACNWLGVSRQRPSPALWALLLMPERIDADLAWPEGTLQVYQRSVSRAGAVPSGVDVVLTPSVARPWRGEGTAVALQVDASSGGRLVASATTVGRVPAIPRAGGSEATVTVPPHPVVDGPGRSETFVVSDADVLAFGRLVRERYGVHADAGTAWASGYKNIVVQGPTLMARTAQCLRFSSAGLLEMWFTHPVPSGAAVTATSPDGQAWALRIASQSRPVAYTVVRDARDAEGALAAPSPH
ncbi:MAG TPA: hypothetical protein VK611_16215 [Acidimicrobiales bacterium]|nr:hypothetical protein [Acidimicrobiales bacterium]